MESTELTLVDLLSQALTENLDDNGADGSEQKTTVPSVISPLWDQSKRKNKNKNKSTQTKKCKKEKGEAEGGEGEEKAVQRAASNSLEIRQIENETNLGKHSKSQGYSHGSNASQEAHPHEQTQTIETREGREGGSDFVAIHGNKNKNRNTNKNKREMTNNRHFMYSNINNDNKSDIYKLNKSNKKKKLNQLTISSNQKMRSRTTNNQRNNGNKTSGGGRAGGRTTGRTRRNRNTSSQLNDSRTISKEPYFLIFEDLHLNCPQCSFVGTSEGKLVEHLRSRHSNFKQCPDCNKKLGSLQNLIKHIRVHTEERPYPCPVIHCKWAYKQRGDLLLHIGRGKHGQHSDNNRQAPEDKLSNGKLKLPLLQRITKEEIESNLQLEKKINALKEKEEKQLHTKMEKLRAKNSTNGVNIGNNNKNNKNNNSNSNNDNSKIKREKDIKSEYSQITIDLIVRSMTANSDQDSQQLREILQRLHLAAKRDGVNGDAIIEYTSSDSNNNNNDKEYIAGTITEYASRRGLLENRRGLPQTRAIGNNLCVVLVPVESLTQNNNSSYNNDNNTNNKNNNKDSDGDNGGSNSDGDENMSIEDDDDDDERMVSRAIKGKNRKNVNRVNRGGKRVLETINNSVKENMIGLQREKESKANIQSKENQQSNDKDGLNEPKLKRRKQNGNAINLNQFETNEMNEILPIFYCSEPNCDLSFLSASSYISHHLSHHSINKTCPNDSNIYCNQDLLSLCESEYEIIQQELNENANKNKNKNESETKQEVSIFPNPNLPQLSVLLNLPNISNVSTTSNILNLPYLPQLPKSPQITNIGEFDQVGGLPQLPQIQQSPQLPPLPKVLPILDIIPLLTKLPTLPNLPTILGLPTLPRLPTGSNANNGENVNDSYRNNTNNMNIVNNTMYGSNDIGVKCHTCGAQKRLDGRELLHGGRCEQARYCCHECQKIAWPIHQINCCDTNACTDNGSSNNNVSCIGNANNDSNTQTTVKKVRKKRIKHRPRTKDKSELSNKP